MQTSIAITLLLPAATAGLGAFHNARLARRSGRPGKLLGSLVGGGMAAWFAFAAIWLLIH